ncbi:hypothetical protein BDZ85DRAFT_320009 [Elsinoe ampelina]|uniref:Uncharacterized protein n=1 Tax=Elsinoe ampelina TaxID=302913 RepID=A0A6A6G7N5_9PEZI|nr:hypothetical protein BDZ85DRAFT_320009 [Elsinoe ampelina]
MSSNAGTNIWRLRRHQRQPPRLLLDTLKTRLQSPSFNESYTHGLATRSLWRGLYQGVCTVLLVTVPSSGVFFTTYEGLKHLLGATPPPPTAPAPTTDMPLPICPVSTCAHRSRYNAKNLGRAYNALWDVIEENDGTLSDEVWSWVYEYGKFKKASLESLPPPPGAEGAAERDIIQLWSLTFFAVKRNPDLRMSEEAMAADGGEKARNGSEEASE